MTKQEVVISVSKKRKFKTIATSVMNAQVAASDVEAPKCVVDALAAVATWANEQFAESINPAGNPSLG